MIKKILIGILIVVILGVAVYIVLVKKEAKQALIEANEQSILESLTAPAGSEDAPLTAEQREAIKSLTAPN